MSQQQHVQPHRKLAIRRELLRYAPPGRVYVPFIGEGDIASEMYTDREVWGADIDPERVATAQARVTGRVIQADCDTYPFEPAEFAIGDFDAYAYPYAAFRTWFEACQPKECVVFFTDGQKQAIRRNGTFVLPTGETYQRDDLTDNRDNHNRYFRKIILPWFTDYIKPLHVTKTIKYLRGPVVYWGAVISQTPAPEESRDVTNRPQENAGNDGSDKIGNVKDALYEAAMSGNVTAIVKWLDIQEKEQEAKPTESKAGVLEGVEAIRRMHPNSVHYQWIVDYRRKYVAQFKKQGKTSNQIVEALAEMGVVNPNTSMPFSRDTILTDVLAIREEWRQETLSDWQEHQDEVLAVIRDMRDRGYRKGDENLILKSIDREIRLLGLDARSAIDAQSEQRKQQMVGLMEQLVLAALEQIDNENGKRILITEAKRLCDVELQKENGAD